MVVTNRQDDLILLELLDMRDGDGLTSMQMSKATGISRSAIMGSAVDQIASRLAAS